MGLTAFKSQPSSEAVRAFLGRAIAKAKKTPRYIVCDRGKQFDCKGFRDWCRRKGIKGPRYGAVGKNGSIAVVERFILTMKSLLGSPRCWFPTGTTTSSGSLRRLRTGTMPVVRTHGWAARRPTRHTTAASRQPQAAIRAAPSGRAARRAPSRGHWWEAARRKADVRSQLPRWAEALADRHAESGRVSSATVASWSPLPVRDRVRRRSSSSRIFKERFGPQRPLTLRCRKTLHSHPMYPPFCWKTHPLFSVV